MVQLSTKPGVDVTRPIRNALWISAILIVTGAVASFFIKDVFFARDLACAGLFSIALSAVYVVVEKRIFDAARHIEAKGDVEEAGRTMVMKSMIASITKLFALGIGLALLIVVFKLHPVPVIIGITFNYLAVIIANILFRSPSQSGESISQQDKES